MIRTQCVSSFPIKDETHFYKHDFGVLCIGALWATCVSCMLCSLQYNTFLISEFF